MAHARHTTIMGNGEPCPMTDAQRAKLDDLCTRFGQDFTTVRAHPDSFGPAGMIVTTVGTWVFGIETDGTAHS